MTAFLFCIPLLPLLGFLILALSGRRFEAESHRVAVPAVGFSFLLSLAILVGVGTGGPIKMDLYPFIQSGNLEVRVGLYADSLAALLLVLVTGVSTVVLVFSSRYMLGDFRYRRFFSVSCLFTFAMLMLVLSTNFALLYFFWEVMGICSYLLISHYAGRPAAAVSATRVFLVNAVADMGLGLAVFLTFATFGTLDIQEVLARAPGFSGETMNLLAALPGIDWEVRTLTVIALLFFIGAMGKSAQFPLHIWLPYAMEAPTPVSALIHAATLVKAGIFLLIRLSPLLVLAPGVMAFAAVIGILTALLGATAAVTQSDIKKILAYSTMSQLGLMVLACGAGAFRAATFHLLAHGAVKAYLFLGSGGALEGLGQAHGRVPVRSSWKTTGGVLILAAMPPLLMAASGYRQLWVTGPGGEASLFFWVIALGTAFWAGLYLVRALAPRPETPGFIPAAALAGILAGGLSLLLAWIWGGFSTFLGPATAQVSAPPMTASGNTPVMLLSFLAVLFGLGLGLARNLRSPAGAAGERPAGKRLYMLMRNAWYMDEICDTFVLRPTLRGARWLWRTVDVGIIERFILGGAAFMLRLAQWLWISVDVRGLTRGVNGMGELTFRLARWLWQSVDIRLLGGAVDGTARSTIRTAGWLWKWADIRGLERFLGGIGRRNEAAGRILREVEPSLLQHQLLVMIFFLILAMVVFLIRLL